MQELINELYYLPRAIVSDGFEKGLHHIKKRIPLQIHKISTGTKCFNWIVPKKWKIKGGFIEDLKGNRLVDYKDHILHIVVGSLPVDKVVTREELFDHLNWLDKDPERIPYVFKYYEQDWGFCVAKKDLHKFKQKKYKVKIESEYLDDYLSIGECIIRGKVEDRIAFLSHLDHPAQVQDGLSGVAVLVKLAEFFIRDLNRKKPYYTYSFLFFPETIGSIAYLATEPKARSLIKCGAFVEMAGVPNQSLILQLSKQSNTRIDNLFKYALSQRTEDYRIGNFLSIVVNDDGIFNSPGIDIPTVSLSRSQGKDIFKHFLGYHTDLDNPENVDYNQMEEALDVLKYAIYILENDRIPVRNYTGIPHLSSVDLWVDRNIDPDLNKMIRHILYSLDNKNSIFDICYNLNLNFEAVNKFIKKMANKKLLVLKHNNQWF